MPDQYQRELFGEFKKEKGNIRRIADKMTRGQHKLSINAPLENIVLAAIVVMMCIIAAFALGVERGKRFAPKTAKPAVKTEAAERQPESAKPKPVGEAKPVPAEKREAEKNLSYTIQLVAYGRMGLAEGEKQKLLSKNVCAFIIHSGNLYHVCAGNYASVAEAKKDLEKFGKRYKGCFVRKR